jgi:hypothetical protein
MRLVAMTFGTEGDTRPIAALCRALMDAGHEVTLLGDRGTLSNARDLGVPHAALTGDIRASTAPGQRRVVCRGRHSRLGRDSPDPRTPRQRARRRLDAPGSRGRGRLRWADRGRSGRIHRFLGGREVGCSGHRCGDDSAHSNLRVSVTIPATPADATMPQPFQLSPRRRGLVASIPQCHQRGASGGRIGARAQALVWPSDALWDLADAVAAAAGLAKRRMDVRAMDALGARVGCPPIATRLPFCGGRPDLCGVRQHGRLRPACATGCRGCCRSRPASPLQSGLERRGAAESATEFLCDRRYPARLAASPHVHGDSSRRIRDHALCRPCWCAFGRLALRSRPVLLGKTATPTRHSACNRERTARHGRQSVSCYRHRPNVRDAGAPRVDAPADHDQLKAFTAGTAATFGAFYLYLYASDEPAFPLLIFGASLKTWAFALSVVLRAQHRLDRKDLFSFGVSNGVVAGLFWVHILRSARAARPR